MFRAIEIGGEPYWDGGYAGNPTITPLIRESDAHDTILVQINPRERPDTPRSASEILNRLNEISFKSQMGQSRSFGDVGSMSGLPESGNRSALLRCRKGGISDTALLELFEQST
jgi:predicted acylesterase/phospholipase RssA